MVLEGMPDRISRLVRRITRYSRPVRRIINRTSDQTTLEFGENVSVGFNCYLGGEIKLGDNVSVDYGSVLTNTVTVDDGSHVGKHCKLMKDVSVGRHTNLVRSVEILGDVNVGNFCAIAPYVVCQEPNHTTNKPGQQIRFYRSFFEEKLGYDSNGCIEIGNDVWIGRNAIILSGVTIGDGAIVGAGSVVTKDIKPYSVVAGTPAEHVKWRFPKHIRDQLLELKWWEWPSERIKQNEAFFTTNLEDVEDLAALVDR